MLAQQIAGVQHNNFNLQLMLLTKSSSLPQIRPIYDRWDNFFSKNSKNKQLAMEEAREEAPDPEVRQQLQTNKSSHVKNLAFIEQKSTLRSKIESYLNSSGKLGVLEHSKNDAKNRKSLAKIAVQSKKQVHSEAEQLLTYLTKLKGQFNFYCEKNKRMDAEIKNSKAMTIQIKEKIIFFQDILAHTEKEKSELLRQTEENLMYARFQWDRLKHMQQRLKEITLVMKKRVKKGQQRLKAQQLEIRRLSEKEINEQNELDIKKYRINQFDESQLKKSDNLHMQTSNALLSLEMKEENYRLKRIQDAITILDREDYQNQRFEKTHNKLSQELILQLFLSKLLASIGSRYSDYYESYEKAEQLMKMHCMDRGNLVQDSYRKSFEIKSELQIKIKEKERQLKIVEDKNRVLNQKYGLSHFGEIEEIQKMLNGLKIQYKTGQKQIKELEEQEKDLFSKMVYQREAEIVRVKQLSVRLKQWVIKQQQGLDLSVSKTLPIAEHFKRIIEFISRELKQAEKTFSTSPISKKVKQQPAPKLNRNVSLKKKK